MMKEQVLQPRGPKLFFDKAGWLAYHHGCWHARPQTNERDFKEFSPIFDFCQRKIATFLIFPSTWMNRIKNTLGYQAYTGPFWPVLAQDWVLPWPHEIPMTKSQKELWQVSVDSYFLLKLHSLFTLRKC